ncbi:hypothetical protein EDB19DRAFT_2041118, partial [Suillus lakei]
MGALLQPPYPFSGSIPSPTLDLDNHNLNFTPFLNLTVLNFSSDTAACITTFMQHSEFPSQKELRMDVETIVIASSGPGVDESSGNSLTPVTHVSIAITGRLSPEELSAAAFLMMLAYGWCIALGSALDTLGSQAFTGASHSINLSVHF